MDLATKSKLTLAEYNRLEEETSTRYEYHDGEVFAMAGGDPKHGAIAGNMITVLNNALTAKACNVFNSDVKVHVASINKSYYPDAMVTCGPVKRSEQDKRAIANPLLLVEVLSESNKYFDQGSKFKNYSYLSSLQEYVLIEQNQPLMQTFYRSSAEDLWQMRWFQPEDTEVHLRSIGVRFKLADLYHKTEEL